MLVPDRLYKENHANWNTNYQQPDNLKHGNANWSLPVWKEPSSRMWNNQSNQSNQMKSSRKVSAKQHYLSVARYVAGQSTNLSSRYSKFRNLVQRILIACALLSLVVRLLARFRIGQDRSAGGPMNPLELTPLYVNRRSRAERIYSSPNAILDSFAFCALANIARLLMAALSRITFPLRIFSNIFYFVRSLLRGIFFDLACLPCKTVVRTMTNAHFDYVECPCE